MAHLPWPKDKIKQLIDLLHDAPALWDIKCREFHDRDKKAEELQNIASRLSVSEEELAKKIKSIKTQYRREYTKQLQHEKNGLPSARDKEWFGYKPLSFLRKNIASKEVDSPDQDDTGEEDNEDKDEAKSSDSSSEAENPVIVACPPEKTYLKARIKKENIQLPGAQNQNLKRKIHDELFNSTPKHNSLPKIQEIKTQLKDDLTIYGENVASRLRNSMQGYREMAIARHEIDNILFRLEMGEFR